MMDENELRRKAAKIAEDKIGFQIHLTCFVAVNAALVAIWYFTSPSSGLVFPWFIFPLLGWGIGLAAHFTAAYRGEGYVQKMTQRELERLKKRMS